MNLAAMRNEVLATGFDPNAYSARIDMYLNNALGSVARDMDYFGAEATQSITTVVGTVLYPWPSNLARIRSLFNPATGLELGRVNLTDIDRSQQVSGTPRYFATDGTNLHLYPTPDSVAVTLTLRYWMLPPTLVADTDTPLLPVDYHDMLITYALWKCYERDDDTDTAGYYEKQWKEQFAEMQTDLKFPTSEQPRQVRGMWDSDQGLGGPGWSRFGGY